MKDWVSCQAIGTQAGTVQGFQQASPAAMHIWQPRAGTRLYKYL
jgi:hypothetical protein